jgi:hypothetical protein
MPPETAYQEPEFTDDEKKILAELDGPTRRRRLPPPMLAEDGKTLRRQRRRRAPAPAPPAPGANEEDEFKEFLAKHQGKSPEELARIAFDQNKRAAREGFNARQTQQQFDELNDRAKLLERSQAVDRAAPPKFEERLRADPDGATKDLHEAAANRRRAARRGSSPHPSAGCGDNARYTGAASPPRDAQGRLRLRRGDELHARGAERDLGWSRSRRARLGEAVCRSVKAGIVDLRGNLLIQAPEAVSQTDPRLKPPPAAVQTLSSAPARTPLPRNRSAEQMADLLRLPDDEFAKLDPKLVETLLNAA